jgi:hypothetical protein
MPLYDRTKERLTQDEVERITENGTRFADVQKAAGHRDPSTTRLYASGMAPAGGPIANHYRR